MGRNFGDDFQPWRDSVFYKNVVEMATHYGIELRDQCKAELAHLATEIEMRFKAHLDDCMVSTSPNKPYRAFTLDSDFRVREMEDEELKALHYKNATPTASVIH